MDPREDLNLLALFDPVEQKLWHIRWIEYTAEERVIVEECDHVRLSICAIELVKDVNNRHALFPSNEGWDIRDLELACDIRIEHAEACALDVLL